ncbi:methyl-accepting chemotaxis protein [Paenibacillus turpanensis]|uniref:methyl-accepting chemotaxis protein n=1 Tax=Paenibacillus turpanensis TaxID=2689078 RepID=UPI00140B87E4|nr:methyl-accepting chemotaxis protein [Paenibacillus turpanensis]
MIFITVIVVITGAVIGTTSYVIAKQQLVEAGKLDLEHIVEGALSTLEVLEAQVKAGNLTLEEAKEQARIQLSGPKLTDGNGYNFKESKFLYKKGGYILAYDSKYSSQVHPSNKIGSVPENTTNRKKMVDGAKQPDHANKYVTYEDKNDKTGEIRNKIAYMNTFEPWGWYVGIAVYEDEFYAGMAKVKTMIVVSMLGIIIFSLLLFYLGIKKKIKLLKQVTSTSLEIANGTIIQTELPESKDEIGQLSSAFNQMTKQLRELLQKVQNTSNHLLDSSTELSAVSEQTSASGEEVGRAIAEIASGTQDQALDLEGINVQVEQLTNSLQSMNNQNLIMKDITTKTEVTSAEGLSIVKQLKASNEGSLKASESISSGVKDLYAKSQQIYSIMDTISNISAETNLLALNASIEAARAGEHGRGFAVVAQEIRKLAEESKVAAEQVQQVVRTIGEETEKTVVTVEETMKSAKMVNSDVLETEEKFNQLFMSVKETVEALAVFSTDIAKITAYTSKINGGIQSSSSVSQQIAASVEEINASVNEQIEAISNVARSAEQLSMLNGELNNLLKEYKL